MQASFSHIPASSSGYYDLSHGKQKQARRFDRGWCSICWDHHANLVRQAEQCRWAYDSLQQGEFLVLDSETTGLDFQRDEVIELALVTGSGAILFDLLIQPEDLDRYDLATPIHGITQKMLKEAPRFPEVWSQIEQILRQYRRVLVYNAFFDKTMLESTARCYGYSGVGMPHGSFCALCRRLISVSWGYRWATLDWACWRMAVKQEAQAHRALADTQRVLGVLQAMAAQHETIDVSQTPTVEEVLEADQDDLIEPLF